MASNLPDLPAYRRWLNQQRDLLETRWKANADRFWARRDAERNSSNAG